MDHAAVVTGLMRGDPWFLLEDEHIVTKLAEKSGAGQAEDPAPDYY
jgi:hypothetical protein